MIGRIAALAAAAMLVAAAPAAAQAVGTPAPPPPVAAGERTIGRADAPVTVIEYASFTCPHCAQWAQEVLPAFKAAYVDTGKVRLVYRDLPTGPAEPAVLAAKVSRCVAPERAWIVIERLFAGQAQARAAGWPTAWVAEAAAEGGRAPEAVIACVRDPAVDAALEADVEAAFAAGVNGTPTVFVDGVRVDEPTLESLSRAVDARLGGG